jgi:hypothetical protein
MAPRFAIGGYDNFSTLVKATNRPPHAMAAIAFNNT